MMGIFIQLEAIQNAFGVGYVDPFNVAVLVVIDCLDLGKNIFVRSADIGKVLHHRAVFPIDYV